MLWEQEGRGIRGGFDADSRVQLLEAATTAGHCSLTWGEHPTLLYFMAAQGCSSCSSLQDRGGTDFELLNFCLPLLPTGRQSRWSCLPSALRGFIVWLRVLQLHLYQRLFNMALSTELENGSEDLS